jgi:hypothetical protein
MGSSLKAISTIVKACQDKCDEQALLDNIALFITASAFVVGAAFPPAGMALAVAAGALGLISAIKYGVSKVASQVLTASAVEAAVERALTTFTVSQDSVKAGVFGTFASVDYNDFMVFNGILMTIRNRNQGDWQQQVDKQIGLWYAQKWMPNWESIYLPAIRDLRTQYETWYGPESSTGVRYALKGWISSCDTGLCKMEKGNKALINDGRSMQSCSEKMNTAGTNWGSMMKYAKSYDSACTRLSQMAMFVLTILQQYSGCDPNAGVDPDSEDYKEQCHWYYSMEDIMTKMQLATQYNFAMNEAIKGVRDSCELNKCVTPFPQTCSDQHCNYKYGLMISKYRYEQYLKNGVFVPLNQQYYQDDAAGDCQSRYNSWHDSNGFACDGLWAYHEGKEEMKQGNCGDIADYANSDRDLVFGAVPGFCTLENVCNDAIKNDGLWGFV